MTYKVRRGLVAIQRDPDIETEGELGIIIIPEGSRRKGMTGTIVSMGLPPKIRQKVNGKKRWVEQPVEVSVGDRVVIGQAQGAREEVLGDNVYVCRQQDIYATI